MIYKVIDNEFIPSKSYRFTNIRTFRTKNRDFEKSYKAWIKRKTRIHKLGRSKEIMKVVDKIFQNAAKEMLEREGGVVLDGIGYFAYIVSMSRRFNTIETDKIEIAPRYKTDYYSFKPYLFTDIFKTNKLEGWTMEDTFAYTLDRKSSRENRFRKLFYKGLKNLYNGDTH